jgi:hypothetical protein
MHLMSGLEIVSSAELFEFQPVPSVVSVVPDRIAVEGDVFVTVSGQSFINGDQLACRFGGREISKAAWRSTTMIECGVSGLQLGNVTVEVTANGQDFTENHMTIFVTTAPSVHTISPTFGSSAGGTLVTFYGSNLDQDMVVSSFDSAKAECVAVSAAMMTCVTPAHGEGEVEISVTSSLVATSLVTSLPVRFLFVALAKVSKIWPSSGQIEGGTTVSVIGSGFYNSDMIECSFAGVISQASWVSSTLVHCLSPGSEAGESSVEVSSNQLDYTDNGVQFSYRPAATVSSVHPTSGDSVSATVVTVYGSHFEDSPALVCSIAANNGLLKARWVSSEAVICTLPVMEWLGNATVRVSNNGVDFRANAAHFSILPEMYVSKVAPSSGSQ